MRRRRTINWRLGWISQYLAISNVGHCYKCLTTWTFVDEHTTQYSQYRGCFPLCELCWSELTPRERLPFYRRLLDDWLNEPGLPGEHAQHIHWPDIEQAVLAGK